MTIIVGINAFHADASAALLLDGKIVSAVEEERFSRIKHCSGFPFMSIKSCLDDNNLSLSDVDFFAVNTSPSANYLRKVFYTFSKFPSPGFIVDRIKNKKQRTDIAQHLEKYFPNDNIKAQFHFVEHHRAHLASCFYASSFSNSACLSVDGFGDFASTAWGLGSGSNLSVDKQVFFPHSLGVFYTALTQFLGFYNYGDEYKVMGLAPYGRPLYLEKLRNLISLHGDGTFTLNLKYFTHANERLPHQWSEGSPSVGIHFSDAMTELLGPARKPNDHLDQFHMDIASSCQCMYEEAFFNLLSHMHLKYNVDSLCLAGGCAANSVANGKVSRNTAFKNLFVQAAAGDAGGALGSALDVWHQLGCDRSPAMGPSYLGPEFSPHTIKDILHTSFSHSILESEDFSVHNIGDTYLPDESALLSRVVSSIDSGLVVGWFHGRMEWGPRALGHRSILGDPRRSNMKDILNNKIKRRESFRPFAPSVLQEFVSDWFDISTAYDVNVPYMMQVYPILPIKQPLIPAVTHIDGTGRLQTLNEDDNGRYYRLVNSFYKVTGIPMILNTSFNENEPIVCTPEQALDCFLRTNMDILILEDTLISRLT